VDGRHHRSTFLAGILAKLPGATAIGTDAIEPTTAGNSATKITLPGVIVLRVANSMLRPSPQRGSCQSHGYRGLVIVVLSVSALARSLVVGFGSPLAHTAVFGTAKAPGAGTAPVIVEATLLARRPRRRARRSGQHPR
jgi:hypothetical protein